MKKLEERLSVVNRKLEEISAVRDEKLKNIKFKYIEDIENLLDQVKEEDFEQYLELLTRECDDKRYVVYDEYRHKSRLLETQKEVLLGIIDEMLVEDVSVEESSVSDKISDQIEVGFVKRRRAVYEKQSDKITKYTVLFWIFIIFSVPIIHAFLGAR